ncbi:hypothetical protein FB451DRAFT_943214, partial [Mycena latifolia]
FGVVKRRGALFTRGPEYRIETQAMMVSAVGTLHNFLRVHNSSDNAEDLGTRA